MGGGDRNASVETLVVLECQQCLGPLVFDLQHDSSNHFLVFAISVLSICVLQANEGALVNIVGSEQS